MVAIGRFTCLTRVRIALLGNPVGESTVVEQGQVLSWELGSVVCGVPAILDVDCDTSS
jgi:hypothetical protein